MADEKRRSDAKYWVNDFLQFKHCEDDFSQTEQVVAMCKDFIAHLSDNYDEAAKAVMINKVIETLGVERVTIESIAKMAFNHGGVGNVFMEYADEFQAKQDIALKIYSRGKSKA